MVFSHTRERLQAETRAPETARVRRTLVAGVGHYLPAQIVTNDDLAARMDTTDAWIRERTGIARRHIAGVGETAASMAAHAARAALAHAGAHAGDVDCVIVATATPDQAFPAVAVRVMAELGVVGGFGFDISAACAGFIYALSVADSMIRAGQVRGILVIGSEVYSRIMNWEDRGTCVLFGDGAGAVFLQAGMNEGGVAAPGVLSTHLHANGALGDILYVDGAVGIHDKPGTLVMNGREVFRHAVNLLADSVEEAIQALDLTLDDVDWLIPHQANRRIIDAVGRKLAIPAERVVITVDRHANTSAASVPLALSEAVADDRIKRGQLLVLEALGGGLTWGSAVIRY